MIFYSYIKNTKIIDLINKNKLELTKFIFKILKDYISKKWLINMSNIFVFNHKNRFFDIKKLKTNLGIFSQVFLEDKSSLRSDHSIHSISAIGKFKEIIKKVMVILVLV